MTLLALDTTSDRCAVLVRTEGRDVLLEETLTRGHDARLAPLVQAAFAEAGARPRALRRIAVAVGPGSFTGARVGVAFARGLALALKVPAVGVNGLDALAATAVGTAAAASGAAAAGLMVAVHDARRGEVVWRAFRDGASATEAVCEAAAAAAAAIDALRAGEEALLAGAGAELLEGPGRRSLGIGRFALAALADLGAAADPAAAPPEPFYHRAPDAASPGGGRGSA